MSPLAAASVAAGAATLLLHALPAAGRRARVRARLQPGLFRPRPLGAPAKLAEWLSVLGPADRVWTLWLAAALLALVGPAPALFPVVVAGAPAAAWLLARRRGRQRRSQLAPALDAVAAGLRAGLSLRQAVGAASSVGPPLGPELAALEAEAAAGRPLPSVLGAWGRQAHEPDTRLVAAALTVAAAVGGPAARAVDGAAASLRDRQAVVDEAAALSTQAKASAVVMTLAPLAFTSMTTAADPETRAFLLGTPAGLGCLGVGLALDAAGAWWMAALVRRVR